MNQNPSQCSSPSPLSASLWQQQVCQPIGGEQAQFPPSLHSAHSLSDPITTEQLSGEHSQKPNSFKVGRWVRWAGLRSHKSWQLLCWLCVFLRRPHGAQEPSQGRGGLSSHNENLYTNETFSRDEQRCVRKSSVTCLYQQI